jgi:hypothetical protein
MRITLIVILVVLSFIMAGCQGTVPDVTPPPVTPPASNPVVTSPPSTPQAPILDKPVQQSAKPMSDELKAILAKNARVNSYQYIYRDPNRNVETHYVNGYRLKVVFSSLQYIGNFSYNLIYLDYALNTSFIVCDRVQECGGVKGRMMPWDDYRRLTPLALIKGMQYGEITETTQIGKMNTVVVMYNNTQGQAEKMWIWDYWGMPMRWEMTDKSGTKMRTDYEEMVINSVEPIDVIIPDNMVRS